MKNRGYVMLLMWLLAVGVYSQRGIDSGTQYGSGADSIRCLTNISLFTPYAKVNNFQDALPFWEIAYNECPAATKDLYLYGVKIVNWQISQEQDPVKREALIEKLMSVYDQRIKYFGNDPKYGKDWIIARKAQDYIQLRGDKIDAALLYKWLGDVMAEYKEKTESLAVSLYMFASIKMLETDPEGRKAQYIEDFMNSSAILEQQLTAAKAANNTKEATNLEALKSGIERGFSASGAADCETLEGIYAQKVEDRQNDIDFLKETTTIFRRVGCKESETYFAAAGYAHKIEPTAESANGLGNQAFKRQDYETAERYLTEAIEMATEEDVKADIYFILANVAYLQKNYSKARGHCLKALESNPNLCKPYLLIGNMYASSASGIYPDDPVLRKCVYYAAVDKFERARQADPSCTDDANTLIASYRSYFPSAEEIFMHPDLEKGKPVKIGGWIGENTTVR